MTLFHMFRKFTVTKCLSLYICSTNFYQEEIPESLPPGSLLGTIVATDADKGSHAEHVFTLYGDTKEMFTIEQYGLVDSVKVKPYCYRSS